jgi:putative ABC transport system permease protein
VVRLRLALLDRKAARDLWRQRGAFAAVALVVASGIALFVSLRSMHGYLLAAQHDYYRSGRFGEVFATVERAPLHLGAEVLEIPGVAAAETRIVTEAVLDVPGLAEPATGRLVSIPVPRRAALNDLYLRRGRWPAPGRRDEVLASDAFARANRLEPGSALSAVLNGRRQRLRVVGTAISPEFIYEIRGAGDVLPDNRRFGVFWMPREALAAACDLEGAFNDLVVTLAPGARQAAVEAEIDRLLEPYGGLGAYGREAHVSHRFVSDEIKETEVTSLLIPSIFLGVTAFLLHLVVGRLVTTQRDQIAVLKAFGYSDSTIAGHYLKLAAAPVAVGTSGGAAVGLWLAVQLAGVYARFYQFPDARFTPDLRILWMALAVAGGAVFAGAASAAARVLQLPPAEAMRPETPTFRAAAVERLPLWRRLSPGARIAARHLQRRPLRTFLSALGIALAVAMVYVGAFMFDAIDRLQTAQFERVQREDVTVVLREAGGRSAARALGRLPGVERAEPFRTVAARLRSGHRSRRVALSAWESDAELRRIVDQRLRVHELREEGLLLTRKLGEVLGVANGELLTVEVLEGGRQVARLPVAGLVDEPIGTAAYMGEAALHRLLREGDRVSGAFLSVDAARAGDLFLRLKRMPAVSGVSVRAAAQEAFQRTIAESFWISLSSIVGFACVLAFGMVYNGARVALSERARELASLRVLGFLQREVGAMLLGEQAVLLVAAQPLGIALGLGLCALVAARFDSELFRLPFFVRVRTIAFAMLVVAIAGALSAAAVRRRLGRMHIVTALKTRE